MAVTACVAQGVTCVMVARVRAVVTPVLANWASIAFLVFMVPVLYLQNRNLRSAVLLTSSLIALGELSL